MRKIARGHAVVASSCVALIATSGWIACSSAGGSDDIGPGSGTDGGAGSSGAGGGDSSMVLPDGGQGGVISNPTTCEEAVKERSYIGCDYWPTVAANNVWSIFDFAVVVANTGTENAQVHVTGPNGVDITEEVVPDTLETIYLPWVPELKGPDSDTCGKPVAFPASVMVSGGAYHLVSDHPVTVYQFNALEYQPAGGPAGKDWSNCPGEQVCEQFGVKSKLHCFSFSNDASLLLPSTAMTGAYRIGTLNGWAYGPLGGQTGPVIAITATQNDTQVTFKSKGKVIAGGGLPDMVAGQEASVTLQAGDVLEIAGSKLKADELAGSLVVANHPVQVITAFPSRDVPDDVNQADHVEEAMFPAETLGKEYVVSVPAKPDGQMGPGQVVRLIGNSDGTTLTFEPAIQASGVSAGTATIGAGQILDLGVQGEDFKVSGDREFMVTTFMVGSTMLDPDAGATIQKGDPAQSLATPIEQYRTLYVFLAPQDYDMNFANVIAPAGTQVTIDGQPISLADFLPVGMSNLQVARIQLAATGQHKLESDQPVGLQVYGYGSYTSYQYPGGLNLKTIAPTPPK